MIYLSWFFYPNIDSTYYDKHHFFAPKTLKIYTGILPGTKLRDVGYIYIYIWQWKTLHSLMSVVQIHT